MTPLQLTIIRFVVCPMTAVAVVGILGVSPGAFLVSAIVVLSTYWLANFLDAFLRPETPEEAAAIDDEVARMEGRQARVNNNITLHAPPGFVFKVVDDSSIEIIHAETGGRERLHVDLQDGERLRMQVASIVKRLANE